MLSHEYLKAHTSLSLKELDFLGGQVQDSYLKRKHLSVRPSNESNLIFVDGKGGGEEERERVHPTRQAPHHLRLVVENQLNSIQEGGRGGEEVSNGRWVGSERMK